MMQINAPARLKQTEMIEKEVSTLLPMNQYPTLQIYCNAMAKLADELTKEVLARQEEGTCYISLGDISLKANFEFYNEPLLLKLLSERLEVDHIEVIDNKIRVDIAREFARHEDESKYRRLSQDDVEIICAKHVLWLYDSEGERADFSGALLRNIDLSEKNLNGAIFDEAKVVNTNMHKAQFSAVSFSDTKFIHCDGSDMDAEGSDFRRTTFYDCNLDRSSFMGGNFRGATFKDCTMEGGSLECCCLENTDLGDLSTDYINMNRCSYDEQDWIERTSPVLSM